MIVRRVNPEPLAVRSASPRGVLVRGFFLPIANFPDWRRPTFQLGRRWGRVSERRPAVRIAVALGYPYKGAAHRARKTPPAAWGFAGSFTSPSAASCRTALRLE